MLQKVHNRMARATRVRSRITGTPERPRLSVFRSNTHISVQLIDDTTGTTLCSASDIKGVTGSKTERAIAVGTAIAESMIKKGIQTCVFDRGGYLYHGRVKALADAARTAGIQF